MNKEQIRKLNVSIDLSKLINNKFFKFILNILFGITTACLTIVLIESKYSNMWINIILPILSFIIAEIMTFKFNFLQKTFSNIGKIRLIVSTILSIFITVNLYINILTYSNIKNWKVFLIISIPAIITFLYWFYTKLAYYLKKYIKTMDKVEKVYLTTASIILALAVISIYNLTTIFSETKLKREYYNYEITYGEELRNNPALLSKIINDIYTQMNYDVLYSSDTQILLKMDVYNLITAKENDVRQPLFGVFSIPFSIVPKAISMIFPKAQGIYPILLILTQGILAFISFTLLARLMKLKGIAKSLFLLIITVTYSSLLFLLNLEQYIFSVFYLIVFIYMAVNKNKDKDMAYIMGTGSMLTTGILFPLLGENKDIKKSIKNIFITFLKCMAILIISAKIILVLPLGIKDQLGTITRYSTGEENNRIFMYTNFLKNIFVFSDFEVDETEFANKTILFNNEYNRLVAQRPQIKSADTNYISAIGIVVLCLAILGFILNRKDKFIQICFAWGIFSFILLAIMGWGAPENGFILYTFYFGWAFICLVYKAIEKILRNVPKIRNTLYILLIISMIIINFYGIYQIIQFGMKYYS